MSIFNFRASLMGLTLNIRQSEICLPARDERRSLKARQWRSRARSCAFWSAGGAIWLKLGRDSFFRYNLRS